MPYKAKSHSQKLKEDKKFSFLFKQYDNRRETASKRGYSSAWQRARKGYLQKHPLCIYCLKENRTTASDTIDHIIPHKGNKKLFWDSSNWQALCALCHNSTKRREENKLKHQTPPVEAPASTEKDITDCIEKKKED